VFAGGATLGDATNNGTLSFDGAVSRVAAGTWTVASDVVLTNGITDTVAGLDFTKAGAGMLLSNGAFNYTGATNINAGTFAMGSSATLASGTISVGSGATFDVSRLGGWTLTSGQSFSGAGTVAGSLTISEGATLVGLSSGTSATRVTGALTIGGTLSLRNGSYFVLGVPYYDRISTTGSLTLGANSVLTLSNILPDGVTLNEGSFTLASASVITGTFGTVNLTPTDSFTQTLSYLSDSIVLSVVSNGVAGTWIPGVGVVWSSDSSWTGGTPGTGGLAARDRAIFATTAASVAVNIDTFVQLKAMSFDASVGAGYTLTASGTSLISLANNSGTVPMTVLGGTHSIVSPMVLGSNLAVSVGSANAALTLAGAISQGTSSVGLVKTGDGALKLLGANGYSGTTQISAGTLVAGNALALGSGAVLVDGHLHMFENVDRAIETYNRLNR
jgi:autotransporter-associated beta strand protein